MYEGQVIGEHNKEGDLVVNVTKSKKLTNVRAAGSDDKVQLAPPVLFSLEEALEYIKEDEYVEVTPLHMRLRKILLNETDRRRAAKSRDTNHLISAMNSSLVFCSRNTPVKSEVVVMEFCFSTPRICMHMCCASMTTITPMGFKVF